MSTVERDLLKLKKSLKHFKGIKGSEKLVEILEKEIEIYEDALKVNNISDEIECIKNEIGERNYKIAKLSALNREDRKYINILRRRLEEKNLIGKQNNNISEKQNSKQETDKNLEV